jgi:phage shock protein PspC (stress-responsive transcriptional regulator)
MDDTTPTDSETIPDPPTGEAFLDGDHADDTPGSTPEYRRGLVRTRDGRVVAGVSGGLAAAWGTRLWLVRAGFIVASAFAGLGIVLYALGWLLMPEEGESESIAQRIVRRMNVQPTWVGFVLLMAGAMILAGIAGISGGVLVAAGLLVGGYVLYRGDFAMPPAVPASEPPRDDMDATPPPYVYQRAVRPPRPPRPRSYLGRLTVGAMFVVLGVMGALDALDVTSPTSRHYAAAAVLIIGAGLLVGTVLGRSRGLIFLGLLLLPVLAIAAITDFRFGTRFDNLDLRPLSLEEIQPAYSIEAGDLSLDLTGLDLAGETVTLDLDVGVGSIYVAVPRAVDVEATANARLGEANVLGGWSSGLGAEVERSVGGVGAGGGKLIIEADTRFGSISIYRNEPLAFGEYGPLVYERGPWGIGDEELDDLLDGLRNDGMVIEMGAETRELAPRNVEEIPRAYVINGGRLFLDLSAIGFDQEISIALAGDGLVTLGVANDAHVTTVTRWPMEGLGELMDFDGLRYMYERPGRGPLIFIEGYGPQIRVDR